MSLVPLPLLSNQRVQFVLRAQPLPVTVMVELTCPEVGFKVMLPAASAGAGNIKKVDATIERQSRTATIFWSLRRPERRVKSE